MNTLSTQVLIYPGKSFQLTKSCRKSQLHIRCAQIYLDPQFSSVAQLCLTLCDPIDCSTPGFPVQDQFTEPTQTHVHWVSDAIQPSHPLSSPSPPVFNLYQHQGLFKWVISLHQVTKYWSFSVSINPPSKYWLAGSPHSPRNSQFWILEKDKYFMLNLYQSLGMCLLGHVYISLA